MRLWGGESDTGCCSVADVDDARRVAQQLDIDHLVFNFTADFDAGVVDPYVAGPRRRHHAEPVHRVQPHREVRPPRRARRRARLRRRRHRPPRPDRARRRAPARWLRGADRAKDQSYVVHMLDQRALARTLFPVGRFDKAAVRAMAAELGLRTATKPDSQDVCFITSTGGRREFLGRRLPFHPADVVDTGGRRLGRVDAVELVTDRPAQGPRAARRRAQALRGGRRPVGGTVVVGAEADLLRDDHRRRAALTWVDEPVDGDVLVQCSAHGDPAPATVTATDGRGRRRVARAAAARRARPERRPLRRQRHVRARRWARRLTRCSPVAPSRCGRRRPPTSSGWPRSGPRPRCAPAGPATTSPTRSSSRSTTPTCTTSPSRSTASSSAPSSGRRRTTRCTATPASTCSSTRRCTAGASARTPCGRCAPTSSTTSATTASSSTRPPTTSAAIRCYAKVGFRPVGVLRRYERGLDGTWHDGLLMDLLADELVR